MKYYKIIIDKTFIGAVHSGQFVAENTTNHKLYFCAEDKGQFVNYDGILYRDYWMQPLFTNTRAFSNAKILEITEEEYNTYMDAIHNNEEIDDEEPEDEPIVIPPTPEEIDEGREFVRASKIAEMSAACRKAIEEGIDLNVHGETHHFSLTTQDQLNLMSLSVMAQTQDIIPYHADGEVCVFFTAEEINQIISAATAHKIYHTTYYNALKEYINALETIEAIAAITYGTPIPDEYQSEVLRVIENETAS